MYFIIKGTISDIADGVVNVVTTFMDSVIDDDSSIWSKLVANIVSVTNLFANNKLSFDDGGWIDIISEFVFRVVQEQQKDKPWENFDE